MARKKRKAVSERKSYLLNLQQRHWLDLEKVSEEEERSIASIIEEYIDYMLKGRHLKEERERGDKPALEEAYHELEGLLGYEWLQMTELNRQSLVWIASCPTEKVGILSKMSGLNAASLGRVMKSEIGLKVSKHFTDRYMMSRRGEIYASMAERALETGDPTYAELMMRLYGDYSATIKQENRNVNINIDTTSEVESFDPRSIDQQVLAMGKRANLTPSRYQKLWDQLELERGQDQPMLVEAEVIE
jgi:hypothetical protein